LRPSLHFAGSLVQPTGGLVFADQPLGSLGAANFFTGVVQIMAIHTNRSKDISYDLTSLFVEG